jgi:hypothetical protein
MNTNIEYNTSVYEDERCIARIHKPIMTESEEEKRKEKIRTAIVRFVKETRK